MRINLSAIAIAALLVASPILPLTLPGEVAQAQAIQSQKADGEALREANRLLTQGYQQYQISQVEAAVQSWQQALKIYRSIQNRSGEGDALGNLGVAYSDLGDYPKAIEFHQQSLAIAQQLKDREGEGRSLNSLGNAYSSLGNYPKAIEYYQQSLTIVRAVKDRSGEGNALGNLGIAYRLLGNYPKAIEYQLQRLAIVRELKDQRGEGQTQGNLANAYSNLGDYPKAIAYQQQSLAIKRAIKDRRGESQSLGNLGLEYRALGDYPKAIEYQQQRLAITREIKDRAGEGQTLGNLGVVYSFLGDYLKAIEYQQQSLTLKRAIKDRAGEGNALGNLGLAYHDLEDYPKAIEYLQQSLAIAREIKDRLGEGNSLGNLGLTYYNLGDYPKAIDYHQQSLAIKREIKDRAGEGRSLGNLGIAYRALKNYPKAIGYLQQRLAITREIQDRSGEGQALGNLGRTLFDAGQVSQSEAPLRTAIHVLETLRQRLQDTDKVSIADIQQDPYNNLQIVLIAQNKIEPALEIAERGRARAFVELLFSRLNRQAVAPDLSSVLPPTLPQIQQIAKSHNATLVQYSTLYDQLLYIWVIQPTGEIAFRSVNLKSSLPKGASLEDYIRTVRSDSLGTRGLGRVSKVDRSQTPASDGLKDLHQLLIEPISSLLPTNPHDRIIFVPQGSLFLVPFAALRSTDGKYLIEKHTILTAPSIQVLDLTRQKQTTRQNFSDRLIVGNPTMPSVSFAPGESPEQLPSLPGAEAEAKAIAQLLHTAFLTGDQATKATVKDRMQRSSLVHLATHGLLDDRRGIGSAIALAPSGTDNGLLTAEEILDLKLNADLVVLSACDTGRGKITGDGVIGLSRALISAGVPSVIVSLWAVPDAPTSALMTQFYQNLQQNPDKAQALRQAMLTTLKQHPNPRDWAAFTLIGEAE